MPTAIQTKNMAFEGLINELDCVDNVEPRLSERADRAPIARRGIRDDRAHVTVNENVARSEFSDDRRPEPATRHLDFSYREIDSCRCRVGAHLNGMLWKVTPSIPLDPADRNAVALYDVDVNWLPPINGRAVLGLKTGQIEALVPPDPHVWSGEPFLQQREVRTPKLAE